MKPQLKTILKHLNTTGSITNREAIVEYNIMSLPRRINDLEQDWGVQFKREMKAHPVTGQRYVRYHVLTKQIVKGYCLCIDGNATLTSHNNHVKIELSNEETV